MYNRNLLSAFNMSHFHRLLDQAVSWLAEQSEIDQQLKDAIICRLAFRREFLSALHQDLEILETRSTENFASCITQLGSLTETVSLGKPVPEAFSLKIQRKLASTVPPRPMVHVNSDDALAHLKRLCQDAIDMQQMLDYTGPSNFKVRELGPEFVPDMILIYMIDCCMDIAFSETPTLDIYSLSTPSIDCQQYDDPERGASQRVPVR